MAVDPEYLRDCASLCVALSRACPHLPTTQALEALGVDLMESAAELTKNMSITPSENMDENQFTSVEGR